MQGIRGAGLKLPIQIPAPCRVIFRMNQHGTNTGNVGRLRRAQQRILKKRTAQTQTLMAFGNSRSIARPRYARGRRVSTRPAGLTPLP